MIDSGIDLQSAEFENRISPASADVTGAGRGADDEGGHGTAVSFTIAGRRNDVGTHGIAFNATILAARADSTGSCATTGDDGGCKFSDTAIAAGVDLARNNGARVINISLGGSAPSDSLLQAIGRATSVGIVVVIAAGNDGTVNPDPLAGTIAASAQSRGLVIIAGSVGANDSRTPGADVISMFSDRAGTGAANYLTAVGERVRAPDNNNVGYYWTGTSFAAPQISGAIALLAQAFPNLTGAQIVSLLYASARDAGDPGVDAIYGHGVLDLTAAFQPVGTTTVAGTHSAASLTANAMLSAPMGDARQGQLGALILDGFSRAFAIDLAQTIQRAGPTPMLAASLRSHSHVVTSDIGGTAVAMTVAPTYQGRASVNRTMLDANQAEQARAIAGSVTRRFGTAQVAFGFAQSGANLTAQMTGRADPAFLVAPTAGSGLGFDSRVSAASAMRQQIGRWGLTTAVENGEVLARNGDALPALRYAWQRSGYSSAAVTLDRRFGNLTTALTATRLHEADTVLGARFGAGLGGGRATSYFVDAAARWNMGAGWSLGGNWRQGWTVADVRDGLAGTGRLSTNAFSADIGKDGVFGRGDTFGLRFAQPLRVEHGGLNLALPVDYDYGTGAVTGWSTERLNLAPTGRELDVEARYAFLLFGGALQTNLYWRRDPGNYAAIGNDAGAALRWSTGF